MALGRTGQVLASLLVQHSASTFRSDASTTAHCVPPYSVDVPDWYACETGFPSTTIATHMSAHNDREGED